MNIQSTRITAKKIDEHVGARIRQRRRALCMTQTALADRIGVTFQQVQKYETGANRVSASRLFLIAEVIQADLLYFWDGLPSVHALSGREADDLWAQDEDEADLLRDFRTCQPAARTSLVVIAEAAGRRHAPIPKATSARDR